MSKEVMELPENLAIANAEHLHEQLETLLQKHQDVSLNGANVARADTAGLQTLLAFITALKQHSDSLEWVSPSEPLREAADLLGLTELLDLPH